MTTATTIDLSRFCANESDEREHLRAPFRRGAWVYATNGHVCVRMLDDAIDAPLLPDGKLPKLEAFFADALAKAGEFASMPKLPRLAPCEACSGRGWHAVTVCPSCKGTGEFEHWNFSYECLLCAGEPTEVGYITHGKGKAGDLHKVCNTCYGRGSEMAAHKVGGVLFEVAYLHWLAALPGVVVRAHGDKDSMLAKFDGGEALLMPRNY